MQRSTGRILTTHTGSLPRPPDVLAVVEGRGQRAGRANPEAECARFRRATCRSAGPERRPSHATSGCSKPRWRDCRTSRLGALHQRAAAQGLRRLQYRPASDAWAEGSQPSQ